MTGHQFSISADHFAWLAMKGKVRQLEIDLLALSICPAAFEIERNLKVVRMCGITLQRAMRLLPKVSVTSARLAIDFELEGATQNQRGNLILPASYAVTLSDAAGRSWRGVESISTLVQR